MHTMISRSMLAGAVAGLALSVVGCGSADSSGPAADPTPSDACAPPMDKWERIPDAVPADQRGTTPEEAVSAVAVATSLQITSIDPGSTPDLADVTVVGDGASGTFHLQKIDEHWLVLGGDGCGALAKRTDVDDCEFPTDLPTEPGTTFVVGCGEEETQP